MQLTLLDPDWPEQPFPALDQALQEPNGLLAVGGCLSPQRLVQAYQNGIFPWYNEDDPILWWSPNPRLVLFPDRLKVSRSLQKTLRKTTFSIRCNQDFAQVMQQCAAPRCDGHGTWINSEMFDAYQRLHRLGIAHSIEAWQDDQLVGGLYGLAIGQVFFGESMFHHCRDASKVAFVHLVSQLRASGFQLIDCQVKSEHLLSLGAEEIPRQAFKELLDTYCRQPAPWPM